MLNYSNTFKLELEMEGTKVLFEPDEERNWRALISFDDLQLNKKLEKDLLELIAADLDNIFKK